MPKEGIKKKRVTLRSIMDRLDEMDNQQERYFTAIQSDITAVQSDIKELKADVSQLKSDVSMLKSDVSVLKSDVSELKTDVSGLKTDMSTVKKDLKEFRGETKSFQSGFSAKAGRTDAFRFNLTGILEAKNILTSEQAIELRCV